MTVPPRVLAIDPSPRGFGYAVLEGRTRLVDWGLVHVRADKNAESLRRLAALARLYSPQTLVLEDCAAADCRRRARARALIIDMAAYADRAGLRVHALPWSTVRQAIGASHRASKEAIAATIASVFPEVRDRLPPHRKTWMSEDPRMSLFDAIALCLAAASVGSSP